MGLVSAHYATQRHTEITHENKVLGCALEVALAHLVPQRLDRVQRGDPPQIRLKMSATAATKKATHIIIGP